MIFLDSLLAYIHTSEYSTMINAGWHLHGFVECSGNGNGAQVSAKVSNGAEVPTVESLATSAVANAASSLTAECAFEGNCVLVRLRLVSDSTLSRQTVYSSRAGKFRNRGTPH